MTPAASVTEPMSMSSSTSPCALEYRDVRVAARHQRLWRGVTALHLDLRPDAAFEVGMTTQAPYLLFTIEALGGQVLVSPERYRAPVRQAGPLSVVPAGTNILVGGRARHFRQLVLRFDLQNAAAGGDAIDPATAFRPRFMFADPRLSKLCLLLADECISPVPMGSLYGDSLILSLLLALSSNTTDGGRSAGGLAPWQMRRLESFVEAHLGDDLSLDRLAHEAGVSRSHLGRVFKQTVGQSPFEWVRWRRIERAKQLLAEGRLPVAEIAIATGFADQAHLTRAFGRLVGVPPGAWRRSQCRATAEDVLSAEVQNGEKPTIEATRFVA